MVQKIIIEVENTKFNTSCIKVIKDEKPIYFEMLTKGDNLSGTLGSSIINTIYGCLEDKE